MISTAVVVSLTSAATWAQAAETTTASAAPVHLIVGYKSGANPASVVQKFAAAGARSSALSDLNASTLQVPAARSAALISALRSDPTVAYVETDRVRKVAEVTPNDPVYTANFQPELKEVDVPAAWDTTTGSVVKIAVIDTGVTMTGDLTGAVLGGYDFVNNDTEAADDFGHGTTVASLIAARGNNNQGMAGVCWGCAILPVKVLDRTGSGYDSTIAKGITWAVGQGAKIINLSLGGTGYSQVLADAVAYANAASVLVVAAAGNDDKSVVNYPAAYPDVLAVGATNRCPNFANDPTCTEGTTDKAKFSNFNSGNQWVDVAAPGIVTGMDTDGNYNTGEAGTSFSAPIVSGIAGLLKSYKPNYTGWSLMTSIQATAVPIGSWVTWGKVSATRAFTFGNDTAAPTISGLTPGQNWKVRGPITFTPYKLGDAWSGIRNVTVYVNGVYRGGSYKAPFAVKWNPGSWTGVANVQYRAYDKAGNVKLYTRAFIADNTAPAVKITKAPKNKSKVKGTVKVYYTGSDKYGIKSYQLLINGKVIQTHSTTKSPFTFVASKYPKNSIKVQVRAYDLAGNSRITSTLTYKR
ncbi:S8 family serine peptidase [Paractinoplanes toevensis]|uniref:S8 family serine peptidase n=1 Tax=Paractinoplanes toevensis TaxID=571911 RepID=UPI001BB3EEE1|nr:S8 family serine peptidase [Actinoplanes toevensis]